MRNSTVILMAFVTFLLVPGCGKAEKKAKKKSMKDPDRQVASQARIALRKIEGK